MTQPYLAPLSPLAPLSEQPVPGAVPPAPEQAFQLDPAAQKELEKLQAQQAIAQQEAKRRERLEEEHGALETGVTHFARGALDAVMAPAALSAMVIEGTGAITGAEWMEEFGRDFGEAASGRELMASYMALQNVALPGISHGIEGDGAKRALSAYEQTQKAMREQEEAWPMLSAVSHVGGAVSTGLLTGGIASGGASLGKTALLGAIEGAGGGAQMGYIKNASLRDVATSALIGAVVTGGLTYGVGRAAQAMQARGERAALLRDALGDADDVAKRAGVTVEEIGGREGQIVVGEFEKHRKAILEIGRAHV